MMVCGVVVKVAEMYVELVRMRFGVEVVFDVGRVIVEAMVVRWSWRRWGFERGSH